MLKFNELVGRVLFSLRGLISECFYFSLINFIKKTRKRKIIKEFNILPPPALAICSQSQMKHQAIDRSYNEYYSKYYKFSKEDQTKLKHQIQQIIHKQKTKDISQLEDLSVSVISNPQSQHHPEAVRHH